MSAAQAPDMRIPQFLKTHRAWLVWRLVSIAGEKKPRKMPHYIDGGMRGGTRENPIEHGSAEDVSRLASFEDAVARHKAGGYTGIGFATLAQFGVVAYDLDDVVVDGKVLPAVLDAVDGTYAEFSPSGNGVRAFFRGALPGNHKSLRPEGDDFKLEVFHSKGFVTVTGNVLPDCSMWGNEDTVAELTPAALALYEKHFGSPNLPAVVAGDMGALMGVMPKVGLSDDQIRAALAALPDDLEYDDWLRVGMAVHHETSGHGFDLWHEKSKASSKYTTERYSEDRWRSFGRNTSSQPTTFRYVLSHPAVKALRLESAEVVEERYDAIEHWEERIKQAADVRELRETVCKELSQDARLGKIEREMLAQSLKKAFTTFQVSLPITQVRELIAPPKVTRLASPEDVPDWLTGWCYIGTDDKFFLYNSGQCITSQSFNAKFDRYMPRNDDGYIYKSASTAALQDWQIKHVNRRIYLPWGSAFFDDECGDPCVNMYRPSSVPTAASVQTDAGRAAVAVVVRHLQLITGNRDDLVRIFVAWMAHNVQKPGVKIRWAPLFKGVQGDGKSTLGKLMKIVMGHANVKNVSPKVLATDFTGWGEGSCVALFEEVRIVGENRHNIMNAIKPYVTNDEVPIHRKGKDEYEITNVTNYLAFTNYSDALPLDDSDRRWLIIFLPFATSAEMAAAVAGDFPDLDAYFNRLHTTLDEHGAELRRWLLDYPIPATFNPNGNAPMTAEKQSMIEMSVSDAERAVRDVIEQGGKGIARNVVATKHLMSALSMNEAAAEINSKELSRILIRIGFVKGPKLRWGDEALNVWVRGNVSRSSGDMRAELDKADVEHDDCADLFQ